jgi:hypothetical protein
MKILLPLIALLLVQDPSLTKTVSGRITMDDNSPLPMVNTFRGPTVMFGLRASVPGTNSQIAEAAIKDDGTFVIPLELAAGMGEFSIDATRIPLGYFLKSMRHGTTDLLSAPLVLTSVSVPNEIQLVLTKTPPVGANSGYKINGRVSNWTSNAGASVPVSLQSISDTPGVRVLRIGNSTVKADGTFEISGVPPGQYRGFSPPDSRDLVNFRVVDRDVAGLEVALPSGAMSFTMTSVPFSPFGESIRPVLAVPAVTTPLVPLPGMARVSVSQSGSTFGGGYREGAVSFFRMEQSGTIREEQRLQNTPLEFVLAPGSYEIRGYSRGCDGNCGRLSGPSMQCSAAFTVAAGQILYAERLIQNSTCTIRLRN